MSVTRSIFLGKRKTLNFVGRRACGLATVTANKCGITEKRTGKPFNAIPGPVQVPFLGNSLQLLQNMERLQFYTHECFDKYGDIFKLKPIGSNYMVLVKDPSIMESVLRVEGKYPERDTVFSPKMAWLFKNRGKEPLIFSFETDKRWKEIRSAIGKQILPRNVHLFQPSFSNVVDRFKDHIKATREEDGTIKDIVSPLRRLLIEFSAKAFFGKDWDVVANPTAEDEEFIEAVEFFIGSIVRVMAIIPWYRIYPDRFSRDFSKALQIMLKRSRAEAENIYEQVTAGTTNKVPGLLEQWLREGKLSEKDAIHEAAGLFSTALDSTSNQAVFLLHDMAIHQEVQEKLYEEIQTVLGEDEFPSHEQLSQMPYMKGCLHECYRLHGTSLGNLRVIKEDTVLLGYKIPAYTTVAYSIYSAGRDSSLFPDPLRFDPERWQRDDIHPYAVQPFGVGPRSCYGKRFAELELKLILIQMVKNFKLSTSLKEMPTILRSVIYPKGEISIKFTDRNKNK